MFRNNKKEKILITIFFVLFCSITVIVNIVSYYNYREQVNNSVEMLIENIKINYPDVSDKEILEVLNSDLDSDSNMLTNYGYSDDISYIKSLDNLNYLSIVNGIIIVVSFSIILYIIIIIYKKQEDKKILKLIKYFKDLDNNIYDVKLRENNENMFSKLQNEIYKVTINLKNISENNIAQKELLNDNLVDISHQIKTPLTSINIMMDSLLNDSNINDNKKREYILKIDKQVKLISNLIMNILKAAKIESNTADFIKSNINVNDLIDEIILDLEILAEVKNVKVVSLVDDKEANFNGDYKWQKEAITNIVKNAIEHSYEDDTVYIKIVNTAIFIKIEIINSGKGISKKDIKNIFKRFYKAENSSEDSIGIGLYLAKLIVQNENGDITVKSTLNKETIFSIKYLK